MTGAQTSEAGELLVVGIGGTTRHGSSTERAMQIALEGARELGATTHLLGAEEISLPHYDPSSDARDDRALHLVEMLRGADGVVVASPGYHGTISGLVKNALDYVEDMRDDERPYFDGLAVGCVACAYGWQAAVNTLTALRSVVHALRGWPTPLGVTVNTSECRFDEEGGCSDDQVRERLTMLGEQVVEFARLRRSRGETRAR